MNLVQAMDVIPVVLVKMVAVAKQIPVNGGKIVFTTMLKISVLCRMGLLYMPIKIVLILQKTVLEICHHVQATKNVAMEQQAAAEVVLAQEKHSIKNVPIAIQIGDIREDIIFRQQKKIIYRQVLSLLN